MSIDLLDRWFLVSLKAAGLSCSVGFLMVLLLMLPVSGEAHAGLLVFQLMQVPKLLGFYLAVPTLLFFLFHGQRNSSLAGNLAFLISFCLSLFWLVSGMSRSSEAFAGIHYAGSILIPSGCTMYFALRYFMYRLPESILGPSAFQRRKGTY